MPTTETIISLRQRLEAVRAAATQYFALAQPIAAADPFGRHFWRIDDAQLQTADALRATIKTLSVDIAGAARGSALIAEADLQDLRHNTRQMLANMLFREYEHTGLYVHHDEGIVLGVDPPSQSEKELADTTLAPVLLHTAAKHIVDVVDLLTPSDTQTAPALATSRYRPNTAFIMMAIDRTKPDLEDVKNSIKEVFSQFNIEAITADDIEHDDVITDKILDEIETKEFLIADLTYERPNVYYEIGHAHARNKRVILYRRTGTRVHFDLAHRNCPEYDNTTRLKELLRKRLESMTNKPGPEQGPPLGIRS